ncbi:amidohydrolase family protein [Actinomadura rugatobispora]|uniref:Amidohydrolase family protein n=1 Tax=Actinomadura rugatobispora TaxID=1994 RepID=A0ABW1AJI6_9ACTN|nr:amidohydrolase family protein [Actinomadura rugatobispora]
MLIDRISGARVDAGEPVTLELRDGRVGRAAGPREPHGTELAADGRVVLPAFVDAHVHLDKAYLLGHTPGPLTPDLDKAIAAVAGVRGVVDPAEGAERAVRTLVRNGVTAARAMVEIDPAVGLDFIALHRALPSDLLHLQLVAFPQRGLELPGMPALLADAMAEGLDVVGGCPYVDADPRRHLDLVFALAERHGAPVDLHLDFHDDPGSSLLDLVVERTRAHGMAGRVTIGHVTTLAAMAPDAADRAFERLASAGISLVALPATDLYLAGHGRPGTRSVAPVDRARAAGVRVAVANNNIGNPFAPFGNADLVQAAWLTGITHRLAGEADRRDLLEAITTAPAAILGLEPHGPAPGAHAHLAVLDARSVEDVVLQAPPVLATLRDGRLVGRLETPSITTT